MVEQEYFESIGAGDAVQTPSLGKQLDSLSPTGAL